MILRLGHLAVTVRSGPRRLGIPMDAPDKAVRGWRLIFGYTPFANT
jgi:hypothetical protein